MPGPGFKIADAYVEIHADVDHGEMQRDVEVGIGSISRAARTVNLLIDLDRSDVIRKLESILSRIPRVARTVQILADVDRTRITAAIESVVQRIPRFARTIELLVDIDVLDLARKLEVAIQMIPPAARTITVNVDLDMGAALARLGALRGVLGSTGGVSAASPFAGLSASLSSLLPIILGVTVAVGGLYTVFAVLPAVIGLTIAAIGGLTTAGFGMIGVLAVVALGTRGMTDAIKQVATTGTVTADALKNLTPSARSFVLALIPAHSMLERFAKIAQENLFFGLGQAIAFMVDKLGVLGPFIGEVAQGLNAILHGVIATLSSERQIEMLASIFSAMASALYRLMPVIPHLVNAFLRIGESAIPVLLKVADKIHDITHAFAEWVFNLDENNLDAVFTTAMHEAKNLLDIFGGLIIVVGKFFGGVFFPGFAAGQSSLKGVVVKLDEISAWLDDPAHIAGIRAWISGFMDIAKTAFDAVGNIIGGLGRVAQFFADNQPALIGAMALLAAGALAYAINMGIAAVATIAATWPILAIAAGITGLVTALVAAYNNWDTFRDAVQGAIGWLQANGPQVFDTVKQAVMGLYEQALAPLVSYISDNREAFGNLGKVLLVVAGVLGGVVAVALVAIAATILATAIAAAKLVLGVTALVAVLYNFAQVLWDVFGNVRDFLGGVWESIENFIGAIPGFLGSIVEAVEGFFQQVWSWAQGVPGQLGALIDPIEERISTFVNAVVTWFTELPGRIGAAITAAPGVIEAGLRSGLEFITGTLAYWAGYTLGTIVNFFIQLPARIAEGAIVLWASIVNAFSVARDIAVNTTVATVDAVTSFFAALPGRVWGALVAIWDVATNIFTTAWNIAVNVVSSTVEAVTGFFASLPGRAAAVLSSLWGAISGAFFSAKDQATSAASSIVDSVTGFLSQLPGRAAGALSGFASSVGDALRSAVGTATSIGGDIIRGLINGAQSMMGALIGWARRAAENFVQGFKDALGIGSPSKVMAREVGRWIPPGIASGIDQARGDLDLAISSSVAGLVGTGRATMSTSSTRIDRSTSASYTFQPGAIVLPGVNNADDFLRRVPVAARQLAGAH